MNANLLNAKNPVGKEEVKKLIGLFGDSMSGSDNASTSYKNPIEDSRQKIRTKNAPTGENHSGDAFVGEVTVILRGALDTHASISREQIQKNIDFLRQPGRLRSPPGDFFVPVDIPNRVDPRLILEIMKSIAERRIPKQQYYAAVVSDVEAKNQRGWKVGGGIVDDVFRVPLLYVRFFLATKTDAKRDILKNMMRIAITGSSLTAYQTAIDLGYKSVIGSEPFEDLAAASRFEEKFRGKLLDNYSFPNHFQTRSSSARIVRVEVSPTPLEAPVPSNNTTASSGEGSHSSVHETVTPSVVSASPGNETVPSDEGSASPDNETVTSDVVSASLDNVTVLPDVVSALPRDDTVTFDDVSALPHDDTATFDDASYSSDTETVTSDVVSALPDNETVTSDEVSYSSDNETVTSDEVSYSSDTGTVTVPRYPPNLWQSTRGLLRETSSSSEKQLVGFDNASTSIVNVGDRTRQASLTPATSTDELPNRHMLTTLMEKCKNMTDGTIYKGDGFTVPFETKHPTENNVVFKILNKFEPYFFFRDPRRRINSDLWGIAIDTSDNVKTLFWLSGDDPDDPLFSGEFIFDEKEMNLTQQREYICTIVGCGSYGDVLRVSRNSVGTGYLEHYAVKLFRSRDADDDHTSEYNSVQQIASHLSKNT